LISTKGSYKPELSVGLEVELKITGFFDPHEVIRNEKRTKARKFFMIIKTDFE
tara:strand:- start:147446 stop:147604 length:159 start_codon:yes stop_codon:yes gene_type:complete